MTSPPADSHQPDAPSATPAAGRPAPARDTDRDTARHTARDTDRPDRGGDRTASNRMSVAAAATAVLASAAAWHVAGGTLGFYWAGAFACVFLTASFAPANAAPDDAARADAARGDAAPADATRVNVAPGGWRAKRSKPTPAKKGPASRGGWTVAGVIWAVTAGGWLIGLTDESLSIDLWWRAAAVLAGVTAATAGLTRVAARLTWPIGPAAVIVLMTAWFTWPVWLARALPGDGGAAWVDRLTPVHPPLVLNGLLVHLGVWSQQPIAYATLTNLNQDVFYALPDSVWPCVVVHTLAAAAAWAADGTLARSGWRRTPVRSTGTG